VFNIGIDEIGIDAVLDNEDVFKYFEEYKDIRHTNIGSVNVFPELSDIQLAALVEAGSPEINEHLTSALVKVASTDSLGRYVYNYLYRGDRLSNDEVRLFKLLRILQPFTWVAHANYGYTSGCLDSWSRTYLGQQGMGRGER
jgi:hypothetical protein